MRIASSDAKALVAEFPAALNVLPRNSSGDLPPSATVYSETLGRISIMSEFANPFTDLI